MDPLIDEFDDRLGQLRNPELRTPVRIEGEFVHLRDPVPEDVEAMVRWWTTDLAWTEWDAPWEPITSDEEKVRAGFEQALARPPDLPRRRLIITLPDDTPIGRVNLYRIEDDEDRIALGINVHESRLWGRGLGREAFALWADFVFREHGKDRIYCETWSGNERMLRVAELLGFVEVKRRRNIREVRGKHYDALRLAAEREDFNRSVVELGITLPE
jgi:RimJ/RimL family protein N-acetyltransferase